MNTPWVRVSAIPEYFGICRATAYQLVKEFICQADPEDYIKDGKLTILRIEAFEEWWRNRGKKR